MIQQFQQQLSSCDNPLASIIDRDSQTIQLHGSIVIVIVIPLVMKTFRFGIFFV